MSSKKALSAEASSFVPGIEVHTLAILPEKRLNAEAAVFTPKFKFNIHAKPFAPRIFNESQPDSKAFVEHGLERTAPKSMNAITTDPSISSGASSESMPFQHHKSQAEKAFEISTLDSLPLSITRSRVESGQFARQKEPALELVCLKELPAEQEIILACTPAGPAYFDGRTEYQRQRHRLQQNAERVLRYNWKGVMLCANGDEMPEDPSDLSIQAQEAEFNAQPAPVHHFNWLGHPVYCKSSTPPAVSFVIIHSLSQPKGLIFGHHNNKVREATLLRNAMEFVDPVYYFGGSPDIVLGCKGTALQELITGDISKIYSSNGYWNDASYERYAEDEDIPETDPLDEFYYDNEDIVANGWFENYQLPTVRGFVQADFDVNERHMMERHLSLMERIPLKKSRSCLSQVVSRNDLGIKDILDVCCSFVTTATSSASSIVLTPVGRHSQEADYESRLENWADEAEQLSDLSVIEPGQDFYDKFYESLSQQQTEDRFPEAPSYSNESYENLIESETDEENDSNQNFQQARDASSILSDTVPLPLDLGRWDRALSSYAPYSQNTKFSAHVKCLPELDTTESDQKHFSGEIATLEDFPPTGESKIENALSGKQTSPSHVPTNIHNILSIDPFEASPVDDGVYSSGDSPPPSTSNVSKISQAQPKADSLTKPYTASNGMRVHSGAKKTSTLDVFSDFCSDSISLSRRRSLGRSSSFSNLRQPLREISQINNPQALHTDCKTDARPRHWRVVTPPSISPIKEDNEERCNEAICQTLSSIADPDCETFFRERTPPLPPRSKSRLAHSSISRHNHNEEFDIRYPHAADILPKDGLSLDINSYMLNLSDGILSLGTPVESLGDIHGTQNTTTDSALETESHTDVVSTRLGSNNFLPTPTLPVFVSIGPRPRRKSTTIQHWRKPMTSLALRSTAATTSTRKVEQIKKSFDKFQKGLKGVFKKEMNVLH